MLEAAFLSPGTVQRFVLIKLRAITQTEQKHACSSDDQNIDGVATSDGLNVHENSDLFSFIEVERFEK